MEPFGLAMPQGIAVAGLPQNTVLPQLQPVGTISQLVNDGSQPQFIFSVEDAPTECVETEEEKKEEEAPQEEAKEIKTRDATLERKQTKPWFSLLSCQ